MVEELFKMQCYGAPCWNCPISRFSTGVIISILYNEELRIRQQLLGREGRWVITVSYSIGIVGAVCLWEVADPKNQNLCRNCPILPYTHVHFRKDQVAKIVPRIFDHRRYRWPKTLSQMHMKIWGPFMPLDPLGILVRLVNLRDICPPCPQNNSLLISRRHITVALRQCRQNHSCLNYCHTYSNFAWVGNGMVASLVLEVNLRAVYYYYKSIFFSLYMCSSLCWWVTLCGGASGEEYLYLVLNLMFQETRHSSQRCVLVKERGEGWKGERGKGGERERDKGRWKVSTTCTTTNMPHNYMHNINCFRESVSGWFVILVL